MIARFRFAEPHHRDSSLLQQHNAFVGKPEAAVQGEGGSDRLEARGSGSGKKLDLAWKR